MNFILFSPPLPKCFLAVLRICKKTHMIPVKNIIGAHEHNISYYYWTQRLKRNQTRKQNETSINGLHLSEKLSKSDLVFKTTKFSFHLGINEWTTNTSPGRKIAPNTGANATKFFTLATKSWKLVANLATRISNHTLRRDLVIVEDL